MPKESVDYFRELCAEAGYDDSQTAQMIAFASNPKVKEKISRELQRSEDYEAQLGRVRSYEGKIKEFEGELKKYSDWYGTSSKTYEDMYGKYQSALSELSQLKGETPKPENTVDPAQFVSKADMERMYQEQSQRNATVIKTAARLSSRHAARYQEELDVDALDKIAVEKNISLDAAYDEMVKPRVEKAREEDMNKKLEQAKRDAVQEYVSKNGLPANPANGHQSRLFGRLAGKEQAQPASADAITAEMEKAYYAEKK